jgi:ATP/maltotriose-dependent transcriptional regulator MalT/DNA-binding SARP family transcriptional activator
VKPPPDLPTKLARPLAQGLVPRERLFALLDKFRRRPLTWIAGPPGAGKTSLVSSWIEARGLHCVWYRVDAGDADPATFFHYLEQATRRGKAPLPALTPEYLPDLPGFVQRWFGAFFARMTGPTVLVLDGMESVTDAAPLAAIVDGAAAVLPEGVTIVATSRAAPPPALAMRIAHAELARLEEAEMRLTPDETRAFARSAATSEPRVRTLHERAGGWAAGVRLLLESTADMQEAAPAATPQALFDYFAAEVFERSSPRQQALWLATAHLPRFDAEMAQSLTGDPGVSSLLDDQAARRYFLERRAGAPPDYQYHALFGEFLQRQLARLRTDAERQALAHRSAGLLAARGDHDAAFRLYCEAGDLQAAVPLVLGAAPALLAQGRWQTLQAALGTLPEPLLEEVPWLRFWLGAALSMVNPPAARAALERAHARFLAADDRVGQAMSIAALIEGYFVEWDHLANVGPWLDAAERIIGAQVAFPSPAAELRFCASVLIALTHCRPASPLALVLTERALALLALDPTANEALAAGSQVLQSLALAGDLRRSAVLAGVLEPLAGRPEVTPLARFALQLGLTLYGHYAHDLPRALRANLEAQRIVREHGFVFADAITRLFEVWTRADGGDFAAASALLEGIEPLLARARPNEVALGQFLRSWFALWRGDPRAALDYAARAVATIQGCETYGPSEFCHGALALAALESGDAKRALAAVDRMRAWVDGVEHGAVRVFARLVEADVLLRTGHEAEGRGALREALATGRHDDSASTGLLLPALLSRLCAEALESGIESEFALRLVRARGLRPPSLDIAAWPWPVRILTLGRFEVTVDGQVVRFTRKAQRRVLDLLKTLVALGAEGVSREAVAAALWPDSEGDAARDAFEVTLHRLRKLLGRDDAILLEHGMLRVNPELAWVDVLAFERLANEANGDRAPLNLDAATRALALYRGQFLHNEDDAPWLLPARERLRSRFVRLAARAAHHHEHAGALARAAEICAAALEVEPLAEELYRRLMACLAAQGRHAEALDAYRRCRQMLSVVLGIAPSRETDAVHASIARAI